MACMHKETFDIFHNDQCIVPEGYIEIDELIAPSVQLLNRKGYLTEWYCSGHPLKDNLMINSSETGYEVIINGRQADGSFMLGGHHDAYISFKEGISLPALPPGFVMDLLGGSDKLIIRKNDSILGMAKFYEKNFFELPREIINTMEQLYEWALSLPEFKIE